MVADFVKGTDQLVMADGITHAKPRKTIGFGEGAHSDHAGMADIHRRNGLLRRGIGISLVQDQHRLTGQHGDKPFDCLGLVPCAHRIVGICKIKQLCAGRPRRRKQCFRVFVIVFVGHSCNLPTEPRDMVKKSGVSPKRGNDSIPLGHQQPHQISK